MNALEAWYALLEAAVLAEVPAAVDLRAERDGLAVSEATGVPWAARSGVMCGR